MPENVTLATSATQEQNTVRTVRVPDKKYQRRGLLWLILPTVGLFVIIVAYAVVNVTLMPARSGVVDSSDTSIANVILAFFGLLGAICVLLIIVGVPIGVIDLFKKEAVDGALFDPRSGNGEGSEVPAEVKRWSWGAFGLTWIWGLSNNVLLALLVFVPFVGLFMRFYIGVKGNILAWQSRKWESVAEFHRVQRTWGLVGGILFGLSMAMAVFGILLIMTEGDFSKQIPTSDGDSDVTAIAK